MFYNKSSIIYQLITMEITKEVIITISNTIQVCSFRD